MGDVVHQIADVRADRRRARSGAGVGDVSVEVESAGGNGERSSGGLVENADIPRASDAAGELGCTRGANLAQNDIMGIQGNGPAEDHVPRRGASVDPRDSGVSAPHHDGLLIGEAIHSLKRGVGTAGCVPKSDGVGVVTKGGRDISTGDGACLDVQAPRPARAGGCAEGENAIAYLCEFKCAADGAGSGNVPCAADAGITGEGDACRGSQSPCRGARYVVDPSAGAGDTGAFEIEGSNGFRTGLLIVKNAAGQDDEVADKTVRACTRILKRSARGHGDVAGPTTGCIQSSCAGIDC